MSQFVKDGSPIDKPTKPFDPAKKTPAIVMGQGWAGSLVVLMRMLGIVLGALAATLAARVLLLTRWQIAAALASISMSLAAARLSMYIESTAAPARCKASADGNATASSLMATCCCNWPSSAGAEPEWSAQ